MAPEELLVLPTALAHLLGLRHNKHIGLALPT